MSDPITLRQESELSDEESEEEMEGENPTHQSKVRSHDPSCMQLHS